jgi:hypothetical protein
VTPSIRVRAETVHLDRAVRRRIFFRCGSLIPNWEEPSMRRRSLERYLGLGTLA